MGRFHAWMRARADAGARIVGYGAPTKATLLMKMADLDASEVMSVLEDNPYKVGRFLPGTGIAIRPTSELTEIRPEVIVIFAWNFAEDIIGKLRGRFDAPVEIVTPLPELRTVTL
jgi:hypothetical protein